ncbi:nicotinate phosphoribosyltransferase [Latilactobacillus sakei]
MQKLYPDDSLLLHTDLYQLNMMLTYFKKGLHNRTAVFECYFRKLPFENGYAIFAGLEHIVNYLENLRFTESDLAYLRDEVGYPEDFLTYLAELDFDLTVRSAVEGELVFGNEPIMQVEGPLAQCQLIETALLNIVNYQTLIATKADTDQISGRQGSRLRIRDTPGPRNGCCFMGHTRSLILVALMQPVMYELLKFSGFRASGTHAHSLVQAYRNDYEAFRAYAETHRDCVFLVDTYDTLKSGVPSAIRVAREFGSRINFQGVRIDSGDMAYISKRVRQQLDEAGFTDAKIYASNDLDEKTIQNLKMQEAKIDVWGVGTKLITAYDQPDLGRGL